MKTYTMNPLSVALTWAATYTTVSGLPTNHGFTTSSLVNLGWVVDGSPQSRTGMTVHSVLTNSMTLVNSSGTGTTVPTGSSALGGPVTTSDTRFNVISPAALGAISTGTMEFSLGGYIYDATREAGGWQYDLTAMKTPFQEAHATGSSVILTSAVPGTISGQFAWDSGCWSVSGGATAGHSPGATSNSSPTVPGDADGIAVIPFGAAVAFNSSGGTDVRTWTGADVIGSSSGPVTVLSVAGTLHFLGAGVPQSGWATSQYQIIEITSGGYVDGPGPWASGELDFQGAGTWNDGTQAGTLKIDGGGVLKIINSEQGGFGGGMLVTNPHLVQCADTSEGTYAYGDGLGMRQQITDQYFSFQTFTGSGPWNSASVLEIPQGEVSMVVGQTSGAVFVPMGTGGGTQIQDPNLFPLFAVYRNGALATDAIVTLLPVDIGIHSWSLPISSNWSIGDLVDVLGLTLGNNGANCWMLHHWSGAVQGVPLAVGTGAGQVQPDGTGKVPASNLPGDYLSSTEQTQLSAAAGTAAALETYMAGTGVKANNLPSDYQQRGVTVTLPGGVAQTTDVTTAVNNLETYMAGTGVKANNLPTDYQQRGVAVTLGSTDETNLSNAASSAATAATQATTAAGNTSGLSSSLSSMASSLSTIAGYAGKWTGITSLAKWLGLIMGSGADATTLAEVQASARPTASYNNATMSEQAIAASAATAAGKVPPTQQNIADALKLAPSAGTPASGSVMDQLQALETEVAAIAPFSGGVVKTIQTNDVNGVPVPGVFVYTSSAANGKTMVSQTMAVSNSGGVATLVLLPGPQWVQMLKAGFQTPPPQQITV